MRIIRQIVLLAVIRKKAHSCTLGQKQGHQGIASIPRPTLGRVTRAKHLIRTWPRANTWKMIHRFAAFNRFFSCSFISLRQKLCREKFATGNHQASWAAIRIIIWTKAQSHVLAIRKYGIERFQPITRRWTFEIAAFPMTFLHDTSHAEDMVKQCFAATPTQS